MKTKLLLAIALFSTLQIFAQTNGWFLYTQASTIYKIVPDDTNPNILHIATDIGLIDYNTSTNMVTGSLNLTTQNPAIGHVNGLSLNPTNTDIALALDDGIAIYDGTTVTIYNYTNSALTVGSVGGSQFTKLEVRYGRQGELYIFKPDVTGYQVFTAGVFDAEVATAFTPRDIIENQAGTMVFFAGNDGLHELVKATTTWTNYTTSNSVLITNPLLSLQVDASDVLYIGSFQGLNTMDSFGVWNTYQQSAPPPNAAFFLPVYEISVDETTGDILIRTSKPSTSFFGLSTVVLPTNTWTNYTSDNTNCLNANVFTATTFDANGKIYAAPQDNSNPGQFIEFVPGTNSCTTLNINYLNAPTSVNSGLISSFTVRKKANGNLDIGFTRGENLYILEIDPNTFMGVFPNVTTLVPSAGKSVFSVIADNDFFIVETNTGWVFVDGTNNTTESNHNLPNHLAIITKKAAAFDSSNGIINLIFKGFDAAFNYRVYKTQCNTATGTCSAPEEIFTNNRDFTQNIVFGVYQSPATNIVSVVATKTDNTGGARISNNTVKGVGGNINNTLEWWDGVTNNTPVVIWDETTGVFPPLDPFFFNDVNKIILTANLIDSFTLRVRDQNGNIINHTFDVDNDGVPDKFMNLFSFPQPNPEDQIFLEAMVELGAHVGPGIAFTAVDLDDGLGDLTLFYSLNDNNLPDDTQISNTFILDVNPQVGSRVQKVQIQNEAAMVMLTNYGMLIKTGIDVSGLTLGAGDVSLKDASLLLYPNPANDMVSFSDNSIKSIIVYDINGRKVLNTTNSNTFSVKTLAQGIYIVKGTSDTNVVVTKKLVVE